MAVEAIKEHIIITTCGTFSPDEIIITSLGMALNRDSATSFCKIPEMESPSSTTFRTCIDTIDYRQLLLINPFLFGVFSDQLLHKGRYYSFAIDETNDPYYGEIVDENKDFVIGGKQKKSTNYFYSYITLYVVVRNRRVTLAVFPVRKNQNKVITIKQFIDIIREKGYRIRVLLLDRGFYSADLFQYLQNEGIPHIMPVKAYGKKMKELLANNQIRDFSYTIYENGENAQKIKIKRFTFRKTTKNGTVEEKNLGFVYFGIDWSLLKIQDEYKSRFAIEASYRMRNIVRPRTSTRNPVIRYYFAIISFLLKNIWVVVLMENFRKKQRGPIVIKVDWFRFEAFVERLWSKIRKLLTIEQHGNFADEIT
ncbi:MAG: transposase [Candidatus Subteraquimicrobiales bacterium]|nr:transposase [Candidatus Subteraquimicrobiales bacterium]